MRFAHFLLNTVCQKFPLKSHCLTTHAFLLIYQSLNVIAIWYAACHSNLYEGTDGIHKHGKTTQGAPVVLT
jgi:hypothetical protein